MEYLLMSKRIESLLIIAEELLHNTKPEDVRRIAKDVLPSRESWTAALEPFLDFPLRSSTAITSPLRGTVHLIDRTLSDTFKERYERVPRDSNHCSSAFRLVYFTTRVLSLFNITKDLDAEELETLFFNIPLSVQLVDDDLSIENSNGITGLILPEQREEYMAVVNEGRKVMRDWTETESIAPEITSFWQIKLGELAGLSPKDYRVGEAFTKIMDSASLSYKAKSPEEITKLCRDTRSANAIWSSSWVAVLRDSILSNPTGTRLCNELVADSTGLKPSDEKKDGEWQGRKLCFCFGADLV